jgi:hypothetical protein
MFRPFWGRREEPIYREMWSVTVSKYPATNCIIHSYELYVSEIWIENLEGRHSVAERHR